MVQNGLFECFVEQLRNTDDIEVINVILDGIYNILMKEKINTENNYFSGELMELSGLNIIKVLVGVIGIEAFPTAENILLYFEDKKEDSDDSEF